MKLGIAGLVRGGGKGYRQAKSSKRKIRAPGQGIEEVSSDKRKVPIGSGTLKKTTSYPSGVEQGTGIAHVASLGGGLNTPPTANTYKPVGQPTGYGGVQSQGTPASAPKDIALTSTVDRSQRSVVPMNARKSGLSDILRSAGRRRKGRYG